MQLSAPLALANVGSVGQAVRRPAKARRSSTGAIGAEAGAGAAAGRGWAPGAGPRMRRNPNHRVGEGEGLGDLEEQLGQGQVEGGADGLQDLRGGLLAAPLDLRQVGQRHPGGLGDLAQGAALGLAPPAQRVAHGLAQLHPPTTSSTRPYSSASAAENQVSRSVSRWMRSTGWPVASARSWSMRARWRRISSAARSRSVA